MLCRQVVGQVVRYGLVGIAINLSTFVAYLGLTWLGAAPKLAVSVLFPVGLAIGFVAHRRVTFDSQAHVGTATLRFLLANFSAYLLNLVILEVAVDHWGFPHAWVQAAAVLVLAAFLFVVLRLFVFPHGNPSVA